MTIVKYTHSNGQTYAYRSEPYYDPIKKGSRPKRTYLGRVDPTSGEIIPSSGKRGRPRKSPPEPQNLDYRELYEKTKATLEDREREASSLRLSYAKLQSEHAKCVAQLQRSKALMERIRVQLGTALDE